jgi:ABC-2 type transport system ATP-binding protein
MLALEIKNLNKSFKNFKLDNINLELPEGYILGYIGQNGAGKTTTIKLIMQQIKKEFGEITVYGKKYTDDEIKYKDTIGFIADDNYIPGVFTVKDVKGTFGSFYKTFDKIKFDSYIKKWDLPIDKKVKDFSKGMKIKLMFAATLSRDTKLLVLDEPTSGLDPVIRDEILDILQDYISDGKRSVIFSTHIMSDLEKIADFLVFIDKGKVIFNDTKDNILESFLLVKGGTNDLSKPLTEKLIGYKRTKIGFEGLVNVKDIRLVSKEMLTEKPTIDEIVVFHINKAREAI